MLPEKLYSWMDDSTALTSDTLNELAEAVDYYPYFQALRFLYLKNLYLTKSPNFYSELEVAAVYVSDRKKLFTYLAVVEGLWNDVFAHFAEKKKEKSEEASSNTLLLIDNFLADFAPEMLEQKPLPTHKAARMAMATQDYAALLLEDGATDNVTTELSEVVRFKNHDLIDEFISFAGDRDAMRQQLLTTDTDSEASTLILDENNDILNEEDLLTESLAKIYIKQKRYYKAIEIIRRLSLKYPEKSIYFADQIRFLEKLINNIKKE
ncbi:MAG: tetratricopeptide repeat protein [Bacteroidales bacterium]